MLRFDVDDVKEFSSLISVTEEYVPELRIDADAEGLSFMALNQSHVVFVSCNINKEYFSVYECPNPTSFMVDVLELKKALNRIKGDGTLTCTLNDVSFDLKYVSTNGSKTFKINLISDLYEAPTPPNIDYPIKTTVDFDRFKEYIGDARLYNDAISFRFQKDVLCIHTNNDYADYGSQLLLDDPVTEDAKVVISGEYLASFIKLGFNEDLKLETGEDMPLCASLTSLDKTLLYKVLIAPRIDNSD